MAALSRGEAFMLVRDNTRICDACYNNGIVNVMWTLCICSEIDFNGKCVACRGELRYIEAFDICNCVHRLIFRSVWRRYTDIVTGGRGKSVEVYCHETRGCSRPTEEFLADVLIVARRALKNQPQLLDCFNLVFVSGHPLQNVLRKLGCSERRLRDYLDTVRSVVGKAFVETQPYALYPLEIYFGNHYTVAPQPFPAHKVDRNPVRAPLRQLHSGVLPRPKKAA